jgi:Ca2+-binding RTX toxin-like protein
MGRIATMALLAALVLALSAGAVRAADLVGDNFANTLVGTNGPDSLDGLGGDDLIVGRGGPDLVLGGTGDDHLIAGFPNWEVAPNVPASSDWIDGGEGDDLIDSADLAGAPDFVFCGPGSDRVNAGVEDFVENDCEAVFRHAGF